MPDSLPVVLAGAATATAGYIGNLIVEGFRKQINIIRQRKSSLIQMQSYLLASKTIFISQMKLVRPLCEEIENTLPTARHADGYDEILATAFKLDGFLSENQKIQHGLVRSYTINAIHPLNMSMLKWLENDTYYKSRADELGKALRQLEAHLVLWLAKYEFWIPNRDERALVFLADERQDGVGFPTGIEKLVIRRTGGV